MAEQPRELTVDELRDIKAKRQVELARIQAFLERPADHVFRFPVQLDDKWLEFRRWTHDQSNLLTGLPFYQKLASPTGLKDVSPEEKTSLQALQVEMVRLALVEPKRWTDFLADAANLPMIERVWQYVSMMSGPSTEKLKEFFESDWGQAYGAFWFLRMGMLPSDVGNRPDSDVKAVNIFLSVYAEKQART